MTLSNEEILLFVATLKKLSRYDFSEYSPKSLNRRVEKILLDYRFTLEQLIYEIGCNKGLLEKVVKDITVNTTELFRDPSVWQILRYKVLPEFSNRESFNIWHAGCSTGQEVYSLLILLNEMNLFDKASVWATDLNSDVLEQAKNAVYKYHFNKVYLDNFDTVIKKNPEKPEESYPVEYSKYFEINTVKDYIRMHKFLTEKPVFLKHDLVIDGNIFPVRFDLILCRNVIIYFNYDLQNKVFRLFFETLKDQGFLLLGLHETILGPLLNKFEKRGQLYKKK